jgi:hypothetical protein
MLVLLSDGEKIKDFGVNDNTCEVWVILESGEMFSFFLNK